MKKYQVNKKISFLKKASQEYHEAFKATGSKHVFKNRKSIIKSIALCFIPFLYAFIALWAFFDPLGNINRLPIALVNQDESASGDNRIINRDQLPLQGVKPNKLGAYEFDIKDINLNNKKKTFKVYYFDNSYVYQKHQNDITFLTEILINKNFTSQWNNYFDQVFDIVIHPPKDKNIWEAISEIKNKPEISLQASFKVNPILGALNNFALNSLKNNIFGMIFPVIVTEKIFDYWHQDAITSGSIANPDYDHLRPYMLTIYDWIGLLVPGMGAHQADYDKHIKAVHDDVSWQDNKDLELQFWKSHSLIEPVQFVDFDVNIIGEDKSPYGFGLSPFFICIGMWVGSLLLTFNFTRTKDKTDSKFWSNYLAKTSWMLIFGFIQATILTTSLLLLFNSIDMFQRCWQLYLFMWFVTFCFNIIVQGIAHMFKDHDLGRFLIIILLIFQLMSSGGTFPVELEPAFFQVISHFLPFTYAIKGFREILIAPSITGILFNVGIILAMAIIIMGISFFLNWVYDYNDAKKAKKAQTQEKSIIEEITIN